MGQLFNCIHCHILINTLKKKICDKRLIDLLFKMYNCLILCPTGFYLQKKKNKIQANYFSFILCNIFLSKLDLFIREIFFMSSVKKRGLFNRPNLHVIIPHHVLLFRSKNRISHLPVLNNNSNLINKSKIRYLRYQDNCLLGVKGPYNFVLNLRTRLVKVLQSAFHLKIHINTLKIINTYCNKVKFLGVIIYNQCLATLLAKNSFFFNKIKRENTFLTTKNSSYIQEFLCNISPYVNVEDKKKSQSYNTTVSVFKKGVQTFSFFNYLFFFKIVFKLITQYIIYFILINTNKNFLTSIIKFNFQCGNIFEFADFYVLLQITKLRYK